MKIFNYTFVLLFLSFAALQYNDPDPIVWIAIYGAMAYVCFMATRGKFSIPLALAMAATYLAYIVILFPGFLDWLASDDRSLLFDDLAKMQFPYIEETREIIGLMICQAVLAINYMMRKSRVSATQ